MSEKVQFLTVSADEAGQRLDNFLLRVLKKAPKSLIYRIVRKGEVRINKGRCKPDRRLTAGDVVRVPPVSLPAEHVPAAPGEGLMQLLKSSVLYEDKGLVVVNKPSGLAVHGGSGINLGLVEAMRHIWQIPYLELVHRLDRETSGCLVLAKKRSVLRQLHHMLREEKGMDKQYLALVKGHWSKHKDAVAAPLKKNELQSGERIVRVDAEGKASKTLFKVEQEYSRCTLVRAKPITGRTHQIRVHAQYAGHPLVADEKYGDEQFNREMRALGFKRLFLHASVLRFELESGVVIAVEAPLPTDLNLPLQALS